jgi:hypothetical protein
MKSVASLKIVRGIPFQICQIFYIHSTAVAPEALKFISHVVSADKKNENKEVAVNDFLPPPTALEAIQHSM